MREGRFEKWTSTRSGYSDRIPRDRPPIKEWPGELPRGGDSMPGHKGAKSCRDKRAPPSRWAERASPRGARRRRGSHGRRLWEGRGGGGGHRPPRPGSKRPRPGRYPRPHRKPLAEPRARPEPTRHPQADPVHFPLTFLYSPNSPGAPPPPPQPPQQFPPEILPGLPAARLATGFGPQEGGKAAGGTARGRKCRRGGSWDL